MINVYRVKYKPATDTKGASFLVTRIDDNKTYKLPYDYSVNNPAKYAIHIGYGEDVARLEFVGSQGKKNPDCFYAIQHN